MSCGEKFTLASEFLTQKLFLWGVQNIMKFPKNYKKKKRGILQKYKQNTNWSNYWQRRNNQSILTDTDTGSETNKEKDDTDTDNSDENNGRFGLFPYYPVSYHFV